LSELPGKFSAKPLPDPIPQRIRLPTSCSLLMGDSLDLDSRPFRKGTSWKRASEFFSLPTGFPVNLAMPLPVGLGTRQGSATEETCYGLRGYRGPTLVAPVPLYARRPLYKSSFLPLTAPTALGRHGSTGSSHHTFPSCKRRFPSF